MKKKVVLSVVLSIFGIIAIFSLIFSSELAIKTLKGYIDLKNDPTYYDYMGEISSEWYNKDLNYRLEWLFQYLTFVIASLSSIVLTICAVVHLNKRSLKNIKYSFDDYKQEKIEKKKENLQKKLEKLEKDR